MFTGIVEEIGTIAHVRREDAGAQLVINATQVLEGSREGDSIAVNGVCLTISALERSRFTADIMHETLERSSLGSLGVRSRVNLERALPTGGRLGGHFVTGHIDATGRIAKVEQDGAAVWYTVSAPTNVMRYIVEKGSVAIDGISLTVAHAGAGSFAVSTIPHTRSETTLGLFKTGNVVNIECDILGKYVEKMMKGDLLQPDGITPEFLRENGYPA